METVNTKKKDSLLGGYSFGSLVSAMFFSHYYIGRPAEFVWLTPFRALVSLRSLRIFCGLCVFALILLIFSPFASNLYAQTELGVEDDLTVLGTDGTVDDPDVEIKGFTVFGATQASINIPIEAGNVFVNGELEVSSDVYIIGKSTFIDNAYFAGAGSIFVNDGSANQMLQKNAAGNLEWTNVSALGDDLGDHTATEDLDMATFDIVGVSTITVSSITTTAAGVIFSTNVYFMNGKVGIGTASPEFKLSLDNDGGIIAKGVEASVVRRK